MKSNDKELDLTSGILKCKRLGISYDDGKRFFGSMFDRIIAAIENAEYYLDKASDEE